MQRTLERGPKIISCNPPTLQSSHTSPLIMIVCLLLLLLLHGSLITSMLRMIHQPGTSTRAGIDLHLGQKPKLGGRYIDITLIYISYYVGALYIHVSIPLMFLFCSCFPKHKKTKNISVVSLYLFLQFLLLVYFIFQFQFAIQKSKNILLCSLFQKSKTQKYVLFFFGFVKFAAEFNSYP